MAYLQRTGTKTNTMGRTQILQEQELREDLKQVWRQNQYQRHYEDQFGFRIDYGTTYHLFHMDKEITVTYSLAAAKLISRIILNDIVMNKS